MRRAVLAFALVLVVLLVGTAPAGAHTSLVTSTPADGEIIERAPSTMVLQFATEIDPGALQLELHRANGALLEKLEAPKGADTAEVTLALPDLEPGPYVMSWVSVGEDGHRASGEVVFGVGAVALADLRSASAGGTGTDFVQLGGGVARWLLAVALAFTAGGAMAVRWARRVGATRGPIVAAAAERGGRAVDRGLVIVALLLLVRAGLVGWARASVSSESATERFETAMAWPVNGAVVVAVVVALGAVVVHRIRRRAGSAPVLDLVVVTALAGVALAAASLGHAGASDTGAPVLVLGGLHGLASAAWLGPLLVAGLVVRDEAWRTATSGARTNLSRDAGRAVAPVAMTSFLALVASGPLLALDAGKLSELASTFKWVLVAKAALVLLVAVPLGALHDRKIGWTATKRTRRLAAEPKLGRTIAVEGLVLLVVLGGGATLATANPTVTKQTTDFLSVVDDPADCAPLTTGRRSCYRRYLTSVLERDGADVAAKELDRLALEVPEVSTECHQLAHDLGNDAVITFGSAATALAEAPPTCWSGYFHGVVELAVSEIGVDPTGRELHGVCEVLADADTYSLPHYNCVHGLGHGVMLLTDHQLRPALDLCQRVEDSWERASCFGGVFMERVISVQASPERDDSNGDLLYPCSIARENELEQCYLMQSSYFLWKLDYDYGEGFKLCDRAPSSVIDTCYRSMGRDIASITRHDPVEVSRLCGMGNATWYASCVEAAALDAALDAVDSNAGMPLCAVLGDTALTHCLDAVKGSVRGAETRQP